MTAGPGQAIDHSLLILMDMPMGVGNAVGMLIGMVVMVIVMIMGMFMVIMIVFMMIVCMFMMVFHGTALPSVFCYYTPFFSLLQAPTGDFL